MKVRMRTKTVGANFGTVGQAVALNGRIVYEGPTRPYGFGMAAIGDVIDWARKHNHQAVARKGARS